MGQLEQAWFYPYAGATFSPVFAHDTLYGFGRNGSSLIALDAATGEVLWTHSFREGRRAAMSAHQLSAMPSVHVLWAVLIAAGFAFLGPRVFTLMAMVREQPGKLNWTSATGVTDLIIAGFLKGAGLDMVRINYGGVPKGITALMAGEVQVMVVVPDTESTVAAALPRVTLTVPPKPVPHSMR